MGQEKRTVIVAMTGYPCSGKTTLACSIAAALKWPVINQDDVPPVHQIAASPITATPADPLHHDPSEPILALASRQLHLGINVIMDSSSLSHHQLLLLSTRTDARLVVVECKPRDLYEWRKMVENRGKETSPGATSSTRRQSSYHHYKRPILTWEDIEQKLREQHDVYESSDCQVVGNFSKLVVDTTRKFRDSDVARAVRYLAIYRGSLSVDFSNWDGGGFRPTAVNKQSGVVGHVHELKLSDHGNENIGKDEAICCGSCLEPISSGSPAYNCDGCKLAVHKLCAELPDKKEIQPGNHPPFLQSLPREYSFPETKGSSLCETHSKHFYECSECLFKTNLRCRLLPSVLHHVCHEHPLCISMHPMSSNYSFKCKACGEPGQHVSYNCSKGCRFACHPSCALFPENIITTQHRHHLTLTRGGFVKDVLGCSMCLRGRIPKRWAYHCEECHQFMCHLGCAFWIRAQKLDEFA